MSALPAVCFYLSMTSVEIRPFPDEPNIDQNRACPSVVPHLPICLSVCLSEEANLYLSETVLPVCFLKNQVK